MDSGGVLAAVAEEGDVTPHEDEALISLPADPRPPTGSGRLKKPSRLLQHVDEGRPLAGAAPMASSPISATETSMRRALSSSPWLPLSIHRRVPLRKSCRQSS
ncbi:hypothetical protein OPV22_010247 [Ensete ventricosum]|uniref:Uncharacterized protein n=1 Tax=Ensete ventricosum TaxID=4639 RepID=A0AAV8RCZ7_ENSVE|nr:hypothetical protein OPV22_010247 [Ensete ventricosum]